MAGPYPGYGPQAASVAATPKSWFERLVEALSSPGGEWRDPESGQTFPAGGRLGAVAAELTGLAGASRTVANARAGFPLTDVNAPSYAGQYGDLLDTVGLAAPAVALGLRGLAKGAGAVADSFVANSGPRARQRGAIRAGGDERLIPSHATDLRGLERARDSLGPNMIYSPSIGINLNKVNRFKDQNSEGTIYLIPKIGAFDPATSASVLYNRDAYMPRHGSYALNQRGGGKTGENLVFDKGLANLRLIGGEGKQIPKHNPESIQMTWSNTAGHKAALANSPHFKSFAQYESSPAGMATLVEGPKQLVKDAVEPLYAAYRKDMREAAKGIGIPMATPADEARFSAVTRPLIYGNRAEREQVLQGLVQAYGPDALTEIGGTAAKYRQRFSRAPAEYAELQPQGLTPLTEENWAGAMVAGKDAGMRARGLLKNLPVEWFEPGTLTPDHMKRFQGEYGLARRQPIGQRLQLPREFRNDPKTPAPYLTGLAGTHKWPQKGAQNTFQPPKGKPDAFAFSGLPVNKGLFETLEGNFTGELDAQQHLNFVAEQLPLTSGATKADYEASLAATLQVMKQKGWKPDGMAHQFLAGLDDVFSQANFKLAMGLLQESKLSANPMKWLEDELSYSTNMLEKYKLTAKPEVLAGWQEKVDSVKEAIKLSQPKAVAADGPGKPPLAFTKPKGQFDWLASADWIPEDELVELQKFAGKANDNDLQQALFEYSKLHPDEIADDTSAHQFLFSKVQAAFAKAESGNWQLFGSSEAKKPLTSTGDAALDAEVDALAKNLMEDTPEPVTGAPFSPPSKEGLSPTGIPWKNIAGSFKDHEADVIGGGTTQGEDIANFIELLKEAGLGVAKGLNASGDKGVQISAADESAAVFIPSSSWSPQKYKDIIKQFLPKVWAHMQANP